MQFNFSRSIDERLVRVLVRKNGLDNINEADLPTGWTKSDVSDYVKSHPELLDTSDDDSLANFSKKFEIGNTSGINKGVFDSEGDCLFESNSIEDCVNYCKRNNFDYVIKHNFSERLRKLIK